MQRNRWHCFKHFSINTISRFSSDADDEKHNLGLTVSTDALSLALPPLTEAAESVFQTPPGAQYSERRLTRRLERYIILLPLDQTGGRSDADASTAVMLDPRQMVLTAARTAATA